ncbi:hypothetical protein [uncultured Sphingomonas sp.]|uniref:hypothetical protein n=1 Tax=uncultured Sphingomonas sp. TaxID=158754 RepID=UPI0025D40380|nr:hypothetical protein [uncultured Sphingomonas sp.]
MLMVAFYMTWLSLFAAPLAGSILVARWRGSDGPALRRGLGWALAYLGLVAFCRATGLQWSWRDANTAFGIGILYAYWIVAAAAWAIPTAWLRIPVGVLAFAPLGPSLLLGTVGVLGLGFVLGDEIDPPAEVRRLSPMLTCEVSTWGYAFSDDGYDVRIYQSPIWLPIVRRLSRTVRINETNPEPGHEHATCESVAAGR